jgi:hypothetical protein
MMKPPSTFGEPPSEPFRETTPFHKRTFSGIDDGEADGTGGGVNIIGEKIEPGLEVIAPELAHGVN